MIFVVAMNAEQIAPERIGSRLSIQIHHAGAKLRVIVLRANLIAASGDRPGAMHLLSAWIVPPIAMAGIAGASELAIMQQIAMRLVIGPH